MAFSVCYFGINLWGLRFLSLMPEYSPEQRELLLPTAPVCSVSLLPFLVLSSSCLCCSSQFYSLYFGVKIAHHIEMFLFCFGMFENTFTLWRQPSFFIGTVQGRAGLYYMWKPCFDVCVCACVCFKDTLI